MKLPRVLASGLLTCLCVACLCLIGAIPLKAAPSFPQLTGRVVDAANVIPDDEEARLTAKLAALERQSHRQLVVVTVPDLQGYEISDYGYQLGRAWGIGSKQRNDGALLIVAPKERKLRIEVGYGLEPVLTDGMSFLIINQAIVPRFKAGDLAGGIEAGTDAIIHQLTLPAEEAQNLAAQADASPSTDQGGWVVPLIVVLFILFFFVLPALRAGARGGRRSGIGGAVGNVILWEAMNQIGRGGRGGGGGGWGSGGGGFSGGGGGGFGGGGSSGSW